MQAPGVDASLHRLTASDRAKHRLKTAAARNTSQVAALSLGLFVPLPSNSGVSCTTELAVGLLPASTVVLPVSSIAPTAWPRLMTFNPVLV
jgi:hypothetical protein